MVATKKTASKATTGKKAAAKRAPTKAAAKKTTKATKTAAAKAAAKKPAKAATSKAAAPKSKATKKATAKASAAPKKAAVKAAQKAPTKKAAAKASAAKPTTATSKSSSKKAAKPTLDKKFVDAQKKLLLEERERYTKSAQTLKDEADSLVEGREPGDVQFDEESGEGDSLAVERERDLALSSLARAAVDQIDAALVRIEDGTYGICVESGKPIPKERLKAIPWAAERVEYKAGGFRRR